MAICSFCGNKLNESDAFCDKCGQEIDKKRPSHIVQQPMQFQTQKKDNVAAVTGFVCALINIFSCGVLTIPGFIISVYGYAQRKYCYPERKELAMTGIILTGIILVLPFIILTLYFIFAALGLIEMNNNWNNSWGF